jgi:hypothetical protein
MMLVRRLGLEPRTCRLRAARGASTAHPRRPRKPPLTWANAMSVSVVVRCRPQRFRCFRQQLGSSGMGSGQPIRQGPAITCGRKS